MNYYNEIKNELVNNEIYKKVKDYSKNRNDLKTYYNVGKLLSDAGKHYGEGIIKNYSKRLVSDIGKKYNERTLFRIKQFYTLFSNEKVSTMSTQLSWSHYSELLHLNDQNKVAYYIKIAENDNLSVRQLREKIKNKEYERLPESTKNKLIKKEKTKVEDFVKNPIIIHNNHNYKEVSEKVLKRLILEDLDNFLKELGSGFSYIGSEYKIKIGNRYNYIDILLFNYIYNSFVVIELKVTELKSTHIGQIQNYMNYVDKNIKNIYQDKTIGIIICRKNNEFVIEYASDERIFSRKYVLK